MRKIVADRIGLISYAIRELVPLAREMERKGEKVIYLNIGDPLKYDFDTPHHIKEALYEGTLKGYNYYSVSEGLDELREAIAYKEKKFNGVDITAEEVIVTQGVSEAIAFIAATLLNSGDEILVPDPTYPLYQTYIRVFHGKPVFYGTIEENGWQPDIDDIRSKISEKTKAIVIINPNNPTGSVYDEKTEKAILDVAAEHDIIVISDEIYDRIVFDATFKSTAALSKDVPIIGLNGFSKVYLMTGWRLGYMYVYDPTQKYRDILVSALVKMARCRLSASTPVQYAGIAAIKGPQDHVKDMVAKIRRRRDYLYKRISEIDGMSSILPKGAFYIFPNISRIEKDDKLFALKLLKEEKVLVVHGSGFGPSGAGHLRIVLLPPIELLEEAMSRIEHFIKKMYGNRVSKIN